MNQSKQNFLLSLQVSLLLSACVTTSDSDHYQFPPSFYLEQRFEADQKVFSAQLQRNPGQFKVVIFEPYLSLPLVTFQKIDEKETIQWHIPFPSKNKGKLERVFGILPRVYSSRYQRDGNGGFIELHGIRISLRDISGPQNCLLPGRLDLTSQVHKVNTFIQNTKAECL